MTIDEQEQYEAMAEFCEVYDDMPDGAFFALAEELHDWNVDDWVWYSEQDESELEEETTV